MHVAVISYEMRMTARGEQTGLLLRESYGLESQSMLPRSVYVYVVSSGPDESVSRDGRSCH